MPQIGNAKKTFFSLYHCIPWIETSFLNKWPYLNFLFDQKYIKDLDYSLIKHVLKDYSDVNQEVAFFVYYLILAVREGHLCVFIDEKEINPSIEQVWQVSEDHLLSQEQQRYLTQAIKQGSKLIPPPLITVCSLETKMSFTPICQEENCFYLQRYWFFETLFLKYFKIHLSNFPHLVLDEKKVNQRVDHLQKEKILLEDQGQAIKKGCLTSFSIIMGGPGTGKTYTAGYLIQIFWQQLTLEQQSSCQIILAAPTGKAAANLHRSLKKLEKNFSDFPPVQVKTLHALLGIKSKGKPIESTRLSADLILVDESSMIDIRLMAYLLEALKPASRLIFLGDPYQLPSVEAGSVFADLINLQKRYRQTNFSITHLKVCLRAELNSLVEFAELINEGEAIKVLDVLKKNSAGIKRLFFSEDKKEAQDDLVAYALPHFPSLIENFKSDEQILSLFDKMRILSPLRKGYLGAETLNQLIKEKISQPFYLKGWLAFPIIINTNDYRQDLFNGETGVLVRKLPLETFHHQDYALFPSREAEKEIRKICALLLPSYDYAYCLSVHKSQGSEFDQVILVLPEGSELFGREIFYTAVTRARKKIEIFGSDRSIEKTVQQQEIRLSGIEKRFFK